MGLWPVRRRYYAHGYRSVSKYHGFYSGEVVMLVERIITAQESELMADMFGVDWVFYLDDIPLIYNAAQWN